MPPQGLELREQFPRKASRCFPTRKIMDACKTSGIFLSLCRQLNCFETARQPLSVLVAWDRWCILWSLTATSLKWSTKCNVGFFPLFFFSEKGRILSLSFCCDSSFPKGFIPKRAIHRREPGLPILGKKEELSSGSRAIFIDRWKAGFRYDKHAFLLSIKISSSKHSGRLGT